MTLMTTDTRTAPHSGRLTVDLVAHYRPLLVPILNGRAETAWTAADLGAAGARFAADRYLALPGLLSGADTALVALEDWLSDQGVKNINNVNSRLTAAKPWYSFYGATSAAQLL